MTGFCYYFFIAYYFLDQVIINKDITAQVVQVLALWPYSKGSITGSGHLCVKFASTTWVLCRYSGFLPQSKHMQTGGKLIGHFKLLMGVNVSVDGCLAPYVSPVMKWQLVLGDPTLFNFIHWICIKNTNASNNTNGLTFYFWWNVLPFLTVVLQYTVFSMSLTQLQLGRNILLSDI